MVVLKFDQVSLFLSEIDHLAQEGKNCSFSRDAYLIMFHFTKTSSKPLSGNYLVVSLFHSFDIKIQEYTSTDGREVLTIKFPLAKQKLSSNN
jgi:hypothetical protein